MSAMGTRDQRTLWKGVGITRTIRIGHTSWTTSLYFIAHASRVPMPTHKQIDDHSATTVAKHVSEARTILIDTRCHRPLTVAPGAFANSGYPDGPAMTVLSTGTWSPHPERNVILIGFDSHLFDPLHHHLHDIDGCELRGDPWRQCCSWWRSGHPVAVLAGFTSRPVLA